MKRCGQIITTSGLVLLLALAGSGCHNSLHPDLPGMAPQGRVVTDRTLDDALATLDTLALEAVAEGFQGSLDAAVPNLGLSRVVFVGETHTQYDNHLVQLALLRAFHRRHPKLALGVEWFQQDVQPVLDDYLAGRITESEMLHGTGYYDRWRYDFRLYRPLVEFARRNGIPILALNAPVAITRQVGDGGLESLSAGDRARLPSRMDDSDPAYRERVRAAYELHPDSKQPFERFLSVQMIWDESMADRAAEFLAANPDYRLLVLAGTGHAGFRNGIPDRLTRRLPVPTASVVTVNEKPASAPQPGGADLLVISPALQLPPNGQLGVMINTRDDRVVVSHVVSNSGAEQAGVRKDDRIVALDGRDIRSFADLKLALIDKRPGETVALQVTSEDTGSRRLEVVLQ